MRRGMTCQRSGSDLLPLVDGIGLVCSHRCRRSTPGLHTDFPAALCVGLHGPPATDTGIAVLAVKMPKPMVLFGADVLWETRGFSVKPLPP